jgi:hypothetical protein
MGAAEPTVMTDATDYIRQPAVGSTSTKPNLT